MDINVQLLSDKARIPYQATDRAAGYDLFSAESILIGPQERRLIKTNVAIEIPFGYYGRIAPRSGLAYKNGIDVLAGVIDSDYRGDIGVILLNTDLKSNFEINIGDRIAQIIIEKCHHVLWIQKESLGNTTRGSKGYGHSG